MDQINENIIISRQKDVVFNKLDDEIVMMSIKNGEYYGLDNIGSRIWEIIEKPVSVNQIADILKNEYAVSESQCKNDVNEFLNILLKKDLIQIG
jgi:Coenzyme PQQ synthesis protein D (PqqD)